MITYALRVVPTFLMFALLVSGCEQTPSEVRTGDTRFAETETGEHSRDVGDFVIHFNAVTTDLLGAEVAKAYKITRSQSRAMLNVTVMKKVAGTTGRASKAAVQARTTNLTGQLKSLELRELVEGDGEAIYYVGDLPIANGETLVFDILVTPEGSSETHNIKFKRRFAY